MISMTPSGEDDYNDNEDDNNDNEDDNNDNDPCKTERRPRQNDVHRRFTEMGMIFANNLQLHGNYTSPITRHLNRPFLSSPQPPFQSEAKCEVLVMKISFYSY